MLQPGMMPPVNRPPDADAPFDALADQGGPPPPVRLRPPRHQVDRRAITLWTAQAVAAPASAVLLLLVLAGAIEAARAALLIAAAAVAVAGVAYTLAMPRIRYRVHRWEVTDEAVYTKAGWLTHEWRAAPLSRVQTVDARRGPLQRALGLASVRITTASAAGDVSIDGLDHEVAADLVEWLTRRTQATPGDAT
jgi:membrane protein YdbS with pleckstrin-like domain